MADKRHFTTNNERAALPDPAPAKPTPTANAWRLSPRHLITAAGGFLSALGIAFTVITHTRLAVALVLGGLFILAVGLAPHIGRVAAKAFDMIGTAMQDAAHRRLKAKGLDLDNGSSSKRRGSPSKTGLWIVSCLRSRSHSPRYQARRWCDERSGKEQATRL